MDYLLTSEQRSYREKARKLVTEVIRPKAVEVDRGHYPWDGVKSMAQEGFFGLLIPKEYQGLGSDTVSLYLVAEEIARGCSSSVSILACNALGAFPIIEAGTPAQKERFLPPIAKGEKGISLAITETGAGSDAAALQTTAVPDGNDYIINGRKTFIGNAGISDYYIISAVTNAENGKREVSAFVVEKGKPGFSFGKNIEKLGLRGAVHGDLIFENLRVPRENLLGIPGDGLRLALGSLAVSRPFTGAWSLGIAQQAMEEAISYAQKRVQFGKPIIAQQGLQFMLADMVTKIHAARLMVHHVGRLRDHGMKHINLEAATAKLFATESATAVVHQAQQIHGGYGYVQGSGVERYYRDVRLNEIAVGTSEIHRIVIAAELIKDLANAD